MAINKIIYGGETLLDLTSDTVTAETLLTGATAHDKSGNVITGACPYDVDSSDATVTIAEMLSGKTAYARGTQLTGTMTNNGAVNASINTKNGSFTIPQGFHDGSGKINISPTEMAKLVAENIRSGVSILGVNGSMTGTEGAKAQVKTATPKTTAQTIIPDSKNGYNYLSQVSVAAIPYVETENSAGGTTVTIG